MKLAVFFRGVIALITVVMMAACGTTSGGRSGTLLPPDGYVFNTGDAGYFGEDYGHGSWDPDDSVADPSIDLPGEYIPTVPKRSSSSSSSSSRSSSASSSSSSGTSGIYKVGKGDTLWGIARAHGTSVAAIKSANGMSSDTIYPGQKLRVSGTRVPSVSSSASASAPAPAASTGPSRTHIVAKGDTLWGISRRYNVTVDAIKSANGMRSDMLRPGDSLRIP
jgi:LysM repeat protein